MQRWHIHRHASPSPTQKLQVTATATKEVTAIATNDFFITKLFIPRKFSAFFYSRNLRAIRFGWVGFDYDVIISIVYAGVLSC